MAVNPKGGLSRKTPRRTTRNVKRALREGDAIRRKTPVLKTNSGAASGAAAASGVFKKKGKR